MISLLLLSYHNPISHRHDEDLYICSIDKNDYQYQYYNYFWWCDDDICIKLNILYFLFWESLISYVSLLHEHPVQYSVHYFLSYSVFFFRILCYLPISFYFNAFDFPLIFYCIWYFGRNSSEIFDLTLYVCMFFCFFPFSFFLIFYF